MRASSRNPSRPASRLWSAARTLLRVLLLSVSVVGFMLFVGQCFRRAAPDARAGHRRAPSGVAGVSAAAAMSDGIPKDTWPKSWFHAPRTASQVGIKTFIESPVLARQVSAGTLPPVERRLPEDPIVVEPAERLGTHGGTASVFAGDLVILNNVEPPFRVGPEVRRSIPNLARKAVFSDGGRTVTLHLRKGVKWSDGHPFTADDYVFWFRRVEMNKELRPVVGPPWKGARVTKVDDVTVRFTFVRPNPFFLKALAHSGHNYAFPKHFMKRYHPDFVPRERLVADARKEGFRNWLSYFWAVYNTGDRKVYHRPVLEAFVVERRGTSISTYRRNPYYPKVDPAGRQLPYIDRIEVHEITNQEVIAAKASTGQVTVSGTQLRTSDIPLFKIGERTNDYTTYIWYRLHGVDVVIQPNLTHPDPALRRIFQDVRFRKALSLSIDRQEINRTVYFGRATPRQTTVIPSSKFYEPAFAAAHIRHDPAAARGLLDEMGLIDRDGDGFRDRPGGGPLNVTLEWTPMETPKGLTMELVCDHWRAVGLSINLKQINSSLQATRARANLMDMTLWHADRTSDILFPREPFWFVPMHSNWEECHWTLWSDWYLGDGKKGEKPPEEILQLIRWWDEMRTTMDESRRIELGKRILRSQAENLWTIGTVGLAPQPLVVSNKLRNVPKAGYWGWDNRWSLPYYPETWCLQAH